MIEKRAFFHSPHIFRSSIAQQAREHHEEHKEQAEARHTRVLEGDEPIVAMWSVWW